ncbi:MAG TPA: carboxypeptidase-like regulatory domain-containing protein [Bacteroidia bacterium]|nr:carboxypeptidase-like regulatory domain-containing protein [Bacteroidia bacterium]
MKTRRSVVWLFFLAATLAACHNMQEYESYGQKFLSGNNDRKKAGTGSLIFRSHRHNVLRIKRTETNDEYGTVEGNVVPAGKGIMVTLSDSVSVFSAHANPVSGHFQFRYVPEGKYTLKVYPADGDEPLVSLPGIDVVAGMVTDAGNILVYHPKGRSGWLPGSWSGYLADGGAEISALPQP